MSNSCDEKVDVDVSSYYGNIPYPTLSIPENMAQQSVSIGGLGNSASINKEHICNEVLRKYNEDPNSTVKDAVENAIDLVKEVLGVP